MYEFDVKCSTVAIFSDDIGHDDKSAGGEQSAIASQEAMLTSSSVSIPTMDEPTQLLEDLEMSDWTSGDDQDNLVDDESVVDMLDVDGADPVVSFVS